MREFHHENRPLFQPEWDWPIVPTHQKHSERVTLLRPIPYELSIPTGGLEARVHHGRALSLNISSGGMLILMDQAPLLDQVIKVHVPTPVVLAETPTLAEVRWTRKLPFPPSGGNGSYFVGLKFLF
jgi:hypothetical protein